jgi:uncharacterized membrane protein
MNDEINSPGKSDSSAIEKALSNIKIAWITGIIISGLCIIVVIASLFTKVDSSFSNPILFLALLVFGLSYGIYKKSRVCSIIILVMWILWTLTCVIHGDFVPALMGAIICIPFYIGLKGTLAYYKLDTVIKMMHRK